jgi:hypothetical protein
MLAPLFDQIPGQALVAARGDVCQRSRVLRPLPEIGQLGRRGELGEQVRGRALPRIDVS